MLLHLAGHGLTFVGYSAAEKVADEWQIRCLVARLRGKWRLVPEGYTRLRTFQKILLFVESLVRSGDEFRLCR